MINGFHALIYSDDPDATPAFFRDVLGWPWLDAHGGWLIFKTPPSELGVHPAANEAGERFGDVPFHQATLMCDDLEATMADLRAKGVEVDPTTEDQGFGIITTIQVPGAGSMLLYEPRHPVAYELDR
jgi:catechol 2,3-dioxygenase-like lactoylglutathione lyase family enzyme